MVIPQVLAELGHTPELLAGLVLFVTAIGEWVHSRKVRRIARLAFGPGRSPRPWGRLAPAMRALATAAVAWGLATLLFGAPKRHTPGEEDRIEIAEHRHVLLVLDVSPSMRLEDAGPQKDLSRMARAREVMESFLTRIPIEYYRISVVAVYSDAKPVVIDTDDIDVVRNILGDLPMHYAFKTGKTQLFTGLLEAMTIAKPWNPKSTTLVLISDGDTVPSSGMPRPPASIDKTVVIGVGDPVTGKFIDGRQSRQDVSTLRQIAARLGGTFHNGNEKHLASELISELTQLREADGLLALSRREYALLACALGAALLAFLPLLLHRYGAAWTPGVPDGPARTRTRERTLVTTR